MFEEVNVILHMENRVALFPLREATPEPPSVNTSADLRGPWCLMISRKSKWKNTAKARATTAPASPRSTKVQHAVAPVYWRSSDHYIYTQPTHKLPTFGSFSGSRKLGWSYYKTTIYWRFIGYHWIRLEYLGYIRGIFMYRSMNFHQLAMRDMPVRACGTVCRVHSLRLLSPGFWWLVQDPFIYLYNILPLKMNRWKPQGCRWLVSWWNFFS